jgi:hypothetical protein
VQAINQPIREQIIHHSPFVPAREWCGLVGWFRTLTVLIVQLESNLRRYIAAIRLILGTYLCFSDSLNIHFCHLPPLDGSQPFDGLPPYKLNLPSHTTISTIEVCTSSRFLMLLCKDSDQHTGPARFLSVWSWGLGEDQAYHPPQYITRTVYFEVREHVSPIA